jgi:hypothetical protein
MGTAYENNNNKRTTKTDAVIVNQVVEGYARSLRSNASNNYFIKKQCNIYPILKIS